MQALGFLIKLFFLLVFPFILLIRLSVYFHVTEKLVPFASIGGGILYTTILLFLYFTFFYGRFIGRNKERPSIKNRFLVALLLVALYSGHGLFYISGDNLKNSALKSEMKKVHPILRLSVSTLIHIDKGLIITDADRQPEDYRKMGLKTKSGSLHYKQSSGYAHAIDIRVKGRNEIRNFLVRSYFKLMGFNTLRHGGTGDHIHVSLISHDRPWAK